jgi:acetoin utilization protein AcuB
MRRNSPSVDPADDLGHAARLMARQGLRAIPVVRRGELRGVLEEADLASAHPSAATTLSLGEIASRLDRLPVARVLSADITAVGRRTPLGDAIRVMRVRRLPVLPVARGRELVGVLAEEDLLELLAHLLESDPRSDMT